MNETIDMPLESSTTRSRRRHDTCNDQVIGAILSGWRYDISGISPELRGDYETHLAECTHCRGRQRKHRTIDVLLLLAFTLSSAAFLLAALLIHRLRTFAHLTALHVPLHNEGTAALSRIPASITISLQAVAVTGVIVSVFLWVLVAIATPVPAMLSAAFRQRAPELHDRLRKQAA